MNVYVASSHLLPHQASVIDSGLYLIICFVIFLLHFNMIPKITFALQTLLPAYCTFSSQTPSVITPSLLLQSKRVEDKQRIRQAEKCIFRYRCTWLKFASVTTLRLRQTFNPSNHIKPYVKCASVFNKSEVGPSVRVYYGSQKVTGLLLHGLSQRGTYKVYKM